MINLGYTALCPDAAYQAIRGREQQLIDFFGGARSDGGVSGKAIRSIARDNPLANIYMGVADNLFDAFDSREVVTRKLVVDVVVRFTSGGVLTVPLREAGHAYAVMTRKFPYVAFYQRNAFSKRGSSPQLPPLFVVAVERSVYSHGGWGGVLWRFDEKDWPEIPEFFRQDVAQKEKCAIVDADGVSRDASPDECEGLERSAVWGVDHVQGRLDDQLAGRTNVMLESLRLRS